MNKRLSPTAEPAPNPASSPTSNASISGAPLPPISARSRSRHHSSDPGSGLSAHARRSSLDAPNAGARARPRGARLQRRARAAVAAGAAPRSAAPPPRRWYMDTRSSAGGGRRRSRIQRTRAACHPRAAADRAPIPIDARRVRSRTPPRSNPAHAAAASSAASEGATRSPRSSASLGDITRSFQNLLEGAHRGTPRSSLDAATAARSRSASEVSVALAAHVGSHCETHRRTPSQDAPDASGDSRSSPAAPTDPASAIASPPPRPRPRPALVAPTAPAAAAGDPGTPVRADSTRPRASKPSKPPRGLHDAQLPKRPRDPREARGDGRVAARARPEQGRERGR